MRFSTFPLWACLLFVLAPFFLAAQTTKPDYGLLWEITSPDADQPSYLFGTMHVTDENIFNLPDTVLLAIDACDGFATEVAFDEALNEFMSAMISSGIEEAKGKEARKSSLQLKLEEMFGEGERQQMARDPLKLFENFGQDYEAGEARETFLDAFLYRIARDGGKVVGGLENIEDQVSILLGDGGSMSTTGPANTEGMLKTAYINGDLEAIEAFINHPNISQRFRDEVLTARNYTMAASADSLIAIRPTFVAVGAAHLPGPEGLIRQMRDRGYTLRRVNATYTGVVDSFLDRPYTPRWKTFEDDELGLRVEVPIEPFQVAIMEDQLDMQFGMDLPGGFFYAFYRLNLPGLDNPLIQGMMLENVAKEMGLEGDVEPTPVTVGELTGQEILGPIGEYFFRIRILFDSEGMVFLLSGISESTAKGPVSERFMSSVETFQPAAIFDRTFQAHDYPQHGFQAALPARATYERNIDIIGEDSLFAFYVHNYEVADPFYGQSLIVQVVDMPPLSNIEDDSSYFESVVEGILEEVDEEMPEMKRVKRNGIEGIEMEMAYRGDSAYLRNFLRGDRYYTLYFQAHQGDSTLVRKDEFFDSFQFLDLPALPTGQKYQFPGFSAYFPTPPAANENAWDAYLMEGVSEISYYGARDTLTGSHFTVSRYDISPYFRADSLLEFLDFWGSDVDVGDLDAGPPTGPRGISTERSQTTITSRQAMLEKFYLSGEVIWHLQVHTTPELRDDPTIQQFLERSNLALVGRPEDIAKPKVNRILTDLQSNEEAVRGAARSALAEYSSLDSEIDRFIAAFRSDDPAFAAVRGSLGQLIGRSGSATGRKALVRSYPQLDTARHQLEILTGLVESGEPAALELAQQLMQTDLPDSREYMDIMGFMETIADQDSSLLNDPKFMTPILDRASYFAVALDEVAYEVQEGYWEPSTFSGARTLFRKELELELDQRRLFAVEDDYFSLESAFVSWFDILDPRPLDGADAEFVAKVLENGSMPIRMMAAEALMEREQPVPAGVLKEICLDEAVGFEMVRTLSDLDRMDLVPKKALKQSRLAEQAMRWDLEEFEWYYGWGKLVKMEELEREEVFWGGNPVYVYTYKLGFEGESDWYLGVTGPFPREKKSFMLNNDLTGIAEEPYSPVRYDSQLREYMRLRRNQMTESDWE